MEPFGHDQSTFEQKVYGYLNRLNQIDGILEQPVVALFNLDIKNREQFPVWIGHDVIGRSKDSVFTRALCASTVQRVLQTKRRYPWRRTLPEVDPNEIWQAFLPTDDTLEQHVAVLSSESYGGLNPLMAAQVFRVFLRAGEDAAHRGIGFLIFFTVLSSVAREHRDPLQRGAGVEPWPPTAYVTAGCLLAVQKLRAICLRRAALLEELASLMRKLGEIAKRSAQPDLRAQWDFVVVLDALQSTLRRFSILTLASKTADEKATAISRLNLPAGSVSLGDLLRTVEGYMQEVVSDIGEKTETKKISDLLQQLENEIVSPLMRGVADAKTNCYVELEERFGLRFSWDQLRQTSEGPRYRRRLADAAEYGLARCREVLEQLNELKKACAENRAPSDALKELASISRQIAGVLDHPTLRHAANWCGGVVNREIAHISAGDYTNFDPSELVCGMAVAVRWRLMNTALQVSDAVTKALEGLRPDGSWQMGKPIFSRDQDLASWPVTSDTMWMLTSAVRTFPEVDVADQAFFRYVDWLERMRIDVVPGPDSNGLPTPLIGWPSDRLGQHDSVHLEATAFAVNALLEIRELVEYRLWQLCEQRFTIVASKEGLDSVDPVDMGVPHAKRLHRVLGEMVRRIQAGSNGARYSLVLHGPPGTSKTILAKALAYEMGRDAADWRAKHPPLVRVTPADFTRMGEARVDSEARLIFDLLRHVRGVVILFDEIDDLLRRRTSGEQGLRFMDLVVPAMLNRLQDLRDACPEQQICFLIATNYIDRIEPALLREGRIDESIPVVYPDFESRRVVVGGERRRYAERAAALVKQSEDARGKRRTEEADGLQKSAAQQQRIAALLGDAEGDIAARTGGWPYLAVKGVCEKLAKTGQKECLEQIVGDRRIARPPYGERLKTGGEELQNEFLQYVLSRTAASSDEALTAEIHRAVGEVNLEDPAAVETLDGLKKLERRLATLATDRRAKRAPA